MRWSEWDGLLHFWGKIYVLGSLELWRQIVSQHQDTRVAGHTGQWKTLELVACNYWWPQRSCYISQYVKTCDLCLWTKAQHHPPIRELAPLPVLESHWDTISVNFIVELLESNGYDTVMNVVDSMLSCWDPHLIAEIPSNPRSIPLLLPQLHSDHPLRFWHYTNHAPKLWPTPETSDASSLLSKNPDRISVFLCLHHSILVLLNSNLIFTSPSQFSSFHFQYITSFQYSCSLVLAPALPSYISASLLLNSCNSL